MPAALDDSRFPIPDSQPPSHFADPVTPEPDRHSEVAETVRSTRRCP